MLTPSYSFYNVLIHEFIQETSVACLLRAKPYSQGTQADEVRCKEHPCVGLEVRKMKGAASRSIKQRHRMSFRSSQDLNAQGIYENVNLTVQVTTERQESGKNQGHICILDKPVQAAMGRRISKEAQSRLSSSWEVMGARVRQWP